jgi:hypothetical protein
MDDFAGKKRPIRQSQQTVYAQRLFGASGSAKTQSGYALCGFLLHHIFVVAGKLRFPLSQPQKRHIPRTLCVIVQVSFKVLTKIILKW